MNISWFREFVVLADTCSYLEASERLFIGQSSLSKHIQALEREIGLSIFDRTSRKVILSSDGNLLLPYAKSIVEADFSFQAVVRNQHETRDGKVTIEAIPALPQYGITDIIARFQEAYPNFRVSVVKNAMASSDMDLRSGLCDFAFIRRPMNHPPEDDLVQLPFCERDDMVAVLPLGHPLADADSVRLEQLREETFISLEEESMLYQMLVSSCQRVGFSPLIAFTCHQSGSILDLISKNAGVALLMRGHTVSLEGGSFATTLPYIVKEVVPKVATSVNLYYKKDRPLSTAAQAFLHCVEEQNGL